MSATNKKGSLFGMMNFKVKNPINNFTETFKKIIDQQWIIAKAMFIHLCLQVFNMTCLVFTQSTLQIRMELEDNEYKRTLWALMIHVITWCYLCYLRRKHFKIPRFLGLMIFNIFALTLLYLQSYSLCANTFYGDTNSKMIYQTYLVSDAFFMFAYVLLQDYIYSVSGNLPFTMFPKFFFLICLYFYFDDRLTEILVMYGLTSIQTAVTGIVAEELLLDVHRDNVIEFGVFDYYTLIFLDVPYGLRMTYYAVLDRIQEFKERLFSSKIRGDKDKNE